MLQPAGLASVCCAGVVARLAGAVEVAQRAEVLGGVPRVEGEVLDCCRAGLGVGRGDVGLPEGQDRDRLGGRVLFLPLDGGVFDWCHLVVDVTLDAQLEADIAVIEALGGLGKQV